MSEWISVDDELPNELQNVLSLSASGTIQHSIYRSKSFKISLVVWEHSNVTHWMPLPGQIKS